MGPVVGGDTRPGRTVPPLARHVRHGGGGGACLRLGGEAAEGVQGAHQLRDRAAGGADVLAGDFSSDLFVRGGEVEGEEEEAEDGGE